MRMDTVFKDIEIEDIKAIACNAGEKILTIYNKEHQISYKEDDSPLTLADKEANRIICLKLEKLYPDIPIISEENEQIDYKTRKNWKYYWCIDPMDGTKEFIKGSSEFTVNIALIYKNTPILGVVYAPVLNDLYWAKLNEGAFKNGERLPLITNKNPKNNLNVVTSRSHLSKETQEFINLLKTKKINQLSLASSLKICMVAVGEADIYPRLASTMEWDTAAADAIIRESGKMTFNYYNNNPLCYNKENLLNPWFIVK